MSSWEGQRPGTAEYACPGRELCDLSSSLEGIWILNQYAESSLSLVTGTIILGNWFEIWDFPGKIPFLNTRARKKTC